MSPPPIELLEAELASPAMQAEVVCRCLRVTRDEVVEAISMCGACSVKEIGRCTGAGRGCMACHYRLKTILAQAKSEQDSAF